MNLYTQEDIKILECECERIQRAACHQRSEEADDLSVKWITALNRRLFLAD